MQIVAVLNYLAVGFGKLAAAPPSRCPAPSAAQRAVLDRIEDRVRTFARLAPCAGSGLGRAAHKLRGLHEVSIRLEEIANQLSRGLGGYTPGPKARGGREGEAEQDRPSPWERVSLGPRRRSR